MRALSIRQPWASLIVAGIKDVENRTWRTVHRGPLLIHASRRDAELSASEWAHLLALLGRPRDALPRGGIIGTAALIDCVTSSASPWFTGPVGFVLREPHAVPFRPMPGRLCLFAV